MAPERTEIERCAAELAKRATAALFAGNVCGIPGGRPDPITVADCEREIAAAILPELAARLEAPSGPHPHIARLLTAAGRNK